MTRDRERDPWLIPKPGDGPYLLALARFEAGGTVLTLPALERLARARWAPS